MDFFPSSPYGRFLGEDELDTFFQKNLDKYKKLERYKIFYSTGLPYIAKTAISPLTTFYISNYGKIPRWSKWDKILRKKMKAETVVPVRTSLKDL